MSGLPGLEETRSTTASGVSQVSLICREGTALYRAPDRGRGLSAAVEHIPRGLSASRPRGVSGGAWLSF